MHQSELVYFIMSINFIIQKRKRQLELPRKLKSANLLFDWFILCLLFPFWNGRNWFSVLTASVICRALLILCGLRIFQFQVIFLRYLGVCKTVYAVYLQLSRSSGLTISGTLTR